jgi:hypothetical protein
VRVAGREYDFVSVCKNHDCYDNDLVRLYAAAPQTVHARVLQRGRTILLGAPPNSKAFGRPCIAAAGGARANATPVQAWNFDAACTPA